MLWHCWLGDRKGIQPLNNTYHLSSKKISFRITTTIVYWFVSDIAIFVLKRDVELQPTNQLFIGCYTGQPIAFSALTLGLASISFWSRSDRLLCDHTTTILLPFPGPRGWASARRELLVFMVQGKINRGRHTNHPAWRHPVRTSQCPLPPSPIFNRPDALPAAQPTVSKHWRQLQKVGERNSRGELANLTSSGNWLLKWRRRTLWCAFITFSSCYYYYYYIRLTSFFQDNLGKPAPER